jgi:DNA mismatch endonuclease, patch repair protein
VVDVVDKITRSRMMASIRGKNTRPEKALRSALHSAGFRFRVHCTKIPGKPDIVLPMYKAVILVHGCFWHRHPGCWWNTNPASNVGFWTTKFGETVERDARNIAELREKGWRVAVVWECSLRLGTIENVTSTLAKWLKGDESMLNLPDEVRTR